MLDCYKGILKANEAPSLVTTTTTLFMVDQLKLCELSFLLLIVTKPSLEHIIHGKMIYRIFARCFLYPFAIECGDIKLFFILHSAHNDDDVI
jgi:hypothetical protein